MIFAGRKALDIVSDDIRKAQDPDILSKFASQAGGASEEATFRALVQFVMDGNFTNPFTKKENNDKALIFEQKIIDLGVKILNRNKDVP